MKKFDFQELVDQNLSGLVWDEAKRRAVLQAVRKEERPVKKLSTTFILIAAIVCLSVTGAGGGAGVFQPGGRFPLGRKSRGGYLRRDGTHAEHLLQPHRHRNGGRRRDGGLFQL